MFPHRVAKRPSFFASLWLSTLIYTTAALAYNLPTAISDFIPSCAEDCFNSFLYVSYGTSRCMPDPTLQCLCSRVGASGFTLGEGALQCIVAEKSIGFCSDIDANDTVIQNAYGMCDDQPNAVQPTHKTITATLVIPTSGGIVTFPPVKTRTSTSYTTSTISTTLITSMTISSYTSLPTTLVMETSSPPPMHTRSTTTSMTTFTRLTSSSIPTTFSSATAINPWPTTIDQSSTATDSATGTTTSTAAAAGGGNGNNDDDDDGGKSLSRDQVAGISVGVLAAAGLAIGAIVIARHYRRRKYPTLKNGFLPMRDTWGYKPDRSDSERTNSWIANQIRPPLDSIPPPPMPSYTRPTASYRRSKYRPDAIGLAISPAYSRVTPVTATSRRMSRLLPAKPVLPVLPLNISKKGSSPPLPQDEWPGPEHYGGPSRQENPPRLPPLEIGPSASVASPTGSKPPPPAPPKLQIPTSNTLMTAPSSNYQRESTLTEFEDDGRASVSSSAQVWRPPPTTPHSAGTYYVADQYGNWVLGDSRSAVQAESSQSAVPEPPPKDNTSIPPSGDPKGTAADTVSPLSAEALKASLAPPLAPPVEIVAGAWQASNAPQRPMGPRAQPPLNTSFPGQYSAPIQAQSIPRRNSSNRRSLTRNLTRARTSASSDVTTISTSSDNSVIDPSPTLEPPGNLSPVVESPNSGTGRSPVTYPKIPTRDPRRISVAMAQGLDVQPDAGKKAAPPPTRPMIYYPPGQPSPTLGMMQPPSGPGMASKWVPKVGRKPVTNPAAHRSGSPTMRMVEPSPEPEEQGPAPPPKSRAPAFFFAPPYPQPLTTSQPSQHGRSDSNANQPVTQPHQLPTQQPPQYRNQQQRPYQPQYQQQQQQSQPQRQYQPYQPSQQQRQQQQPQRQPQPQNQYQQHQQQTQQTQQQRYQQYQQQIRRQQYQQQPQVQRPYYQQSQQPRQPQQPQQPQRPQRQPGDDLDQYQWHPLQPPRKPNPDHDPIRTSGQSSSSAASSLLAKRLGPDRAANMAIPTDPSRGKWRLDNSSSQDESTTSGRDSGLPATPTWLPRLTPTRRGKDLFLNVQ